MNRLLFVTIVAAVLSLVAAATALMPASNDSALRVNDIVFVGPHQEQSVGSDPEHSYGPFWVCGPAPGFKPELQRIECVSGTGRKYWIYAGNIDWDRTRDRRPIAFGKVKK